MALRKFFDTFAVNNSERVEYEKLIADLTTLKTDFQSLPYSPAKQQVFLAIIDYWLFLNDRNSVKSAIAELTLRTESIKKIASYLLLNDDAFIQKTRLEILNSTNDNSDFRKLAIELLDNATQTLEVRRRVSRGSVQSAMISAAFTTFYFNPLYGIVMGIALTYAHQNNFFTSNRYTSFCNEVLEFYDTMGMKPLKEGEKETPIPNLTRITSTFHRLNR